MKRLRPYRYSRHIAPNGQAVGALCLMDMKPRQVTEREKRLLLKYAGEVMEVAAKPHARTKAPASKKSYILRRSRVTMTIGRPIPVSPRLFTR